MARGSRSWGFDAKPVWQLFLVFVNLVHTAPATETCSAVIGMERWGQKLPLLPILHG